MAPPVSLAQLCNLVAHPVGLRKALVDYLAYYVGWNDMRLECESIEQSGCHAFISKDAVPVGKA